MIDWIFKVLHSFAWRMFVIGCGWNMGIAICYGFIGHEWGKALDLIYSAWFLLAAIWVCLHKEWNEKHSE